MRLPTIMLGLAALLTLPALLGAQDAATGPAGKQENAGGKKADDGAGDAKTPKKAAKKAASKAKPATPAKELFGAAKTPAPLAARSIGFYAKGCLAGAAALPIDGPAWQHMRLSRNRNWGHPDLIKLVEKLAAEAKEHDGWPGLLVGDISQPRGGPMLTGHASHQVGLDADVWFTPMPDRRLTHKEREDLAATSMLADDRVSVNPKVWTDAHVRLLKRVSGYKAVERVLVHPAIKKAVCDASKEEKDRAWLSKIRPYWGHYYHFHIRIACPKGSTGCESQPSVTSDDGCGAELTRWLKLIKPPPVAAAPPKPAKPAPERRAITLDQLPADCRTVLATGTPAADTPPPAAAAAKPAAPAMPDAKPAEAPKSAPASPPKPAEAKPTAGTLGKPAATDQDASDPPPAAAATKSAVPATPDAKPGATKPAAGTLGKPAGTDQGPSAPKPAAAAPTKQAKPAAKQVKPAPKKTSQAEE